MYYMVFAKLFQENYLIIFFDDVPILYGNIRDVAQNNITLHYST